MNLRRFASLIVAVGILLHTSPTTSQNKSSASFEIESIRIIALMTKEDGRCWDVCDLTVQEKLQSIAREQERQGKDLRERGTVESERLGASSLPSAEEIESYFDVAMKILSGASTATGSYNPEITIKLRSLRYQTIRYKANESNRASAVFSTPKGISLASDRKKRFLYVDVWEFDLTGSDRMGYRKINVADSVFESGGSIVVRFDQVHFLEIVLRRLESWEDDVSPVGAPPPDPQP